MDLISIINRSIEKIQNQEMRRYIGASSIGNPCVRAIWYGYKGVIGEAIDPKLQITFDIGKKVEELILSYLEVSEVKIIRANEESKFLYCEDSNIPEFQGHMDAILELGDRKVILEIKTAKSSSFSTFKKDGLKKWSNSYYAQLQSYMGMSSIYESIIIAINKDSSEMHSEWVYFNEDDYINLRGKVSYIKSFEEPPARINNNSCFHICQKCKFKMICHYGG
jgi:hypothetical protein